MSGGLRPIPCIFGAVDFSFYARAAWETKTPEDYAGPYFCVSGARIAQFLGLQLPPDCTVCSLLPRVNGDPGAYSLTFNVGSSGRIIGTSLTHYEFYGEVKF